MSFVVFNVFHSKVQDKILFTDKKFKDRLIMYGVNEKYDKEFNPDLNYSILMEYDLPIYDPRLQLKNYCQTSCMYHVFINNFYENTSYIGFLQYDMMIQPDFFDHLDSEIARLESSHVSLIGYELTKDINETLYWCSGIADDNESCALNHYNKFFGTNYTLSDIRNNPKCKLVYIHAFVIPSSLFCKMMRWMTSYFPIIDNVQPSNMSTPEFLERCHGLFIALENLSNPNLEYIKMKTCHNHHYKLHD